MRNKAVIGLGFGDEGKGITTDYLCCHANNPLVVRYSGGQQAGHTVMTLDGKRHVFSNFGSGTLRGAPTYWSKYCTIDPIGIVNEFKKLEEISQYHPIRLYIDERCPVTTPYDMFHNQHDPKNIDHGTCGVGVGATIAREEAHYSLTFGDLFNPFVFQTKLNLIRNYYTKGYDNNIGLDLSRFIECVEFITNNEKHIRPAYDMHLKAEGMYEIIYEGSQGLLLDQNIGFFPHVTRSNTGTKNIVDSGHYPDLYLVTRAYQTRHGNGFMSNEHIPHNIKSDPNETNVFHAFQGDFRRALLDVDLLKWAMGKDDYIRNLRKDRKTLVVTCLDHVEDEYRFIHKGQVCIANNKTAFVDTLYSILEVGSLIVSESPYSEKMIKFH